MNDLGKQPAVDHLTQRELEILRLVAEGLSNQDIAAQLVITQDTVKWYLKQIYGKLHVSSRTQAIAVARTSGLLDGNTPNSAPPVLKSNLPQPPTTFIGRSEELAAVAQHLEDPECRLLSIIGPGGIGKTRLAVQAAHELSPNFRDGVYFVSLAPVNSTDLLIFSIGKALEFSFYGQDPPAIQLLSYLRDKEMLLVLDNLEHLLDGSALLADLLTGVPKLKILVTSRERLNIQSEWVLPIQGMAYPQTAATDQFERYAAVQLFAQSARRVQTSFSLDQNQVDVLRICRAVEGMPLGIELAAAWVRMLPCAQIAEQLATDLDLLSSPLRDVPERHRSLRAVFDHSWALLSDTEQRVHSKLSVFRGGFDLEAAEQVAGASLPMLASLADKSLIHVDGSGHYSLHELLRQYAQDKLRDTSDAGSTADRHLSYFVSLAERAEAELNSPNQTAWYDRLEREQDNVRAALSWSMAGGNAEVGLHLAGALGWFWLERCYWKEASQWYEALLEVNGSAPASVQAKALHRATEIEYRVDCLSTAQIHSEQAVKLGRLAGDKWNIAWALAARGLSGGSFSHDDRDGILDLEEAVSLFRELGDAWGLGHALRRLSILLSNRQDHERATALAQEALALAQEAGTKSAMADTLMVLSTGEWHRSRDLQRAVTLAESSLALHRELRHKNHCAMTAGWLGMLALQAHQDEQARVYAREHLLLSKELGTKIVMSIGLFVAGVLALREGTTAQGARLLGSAEALSGRNRGWQFQVDFDWQLAEARAQINSPLLEEAWAEGREMPLDAAIAVAWQQLGQPVTET